MQSYTSTEDRARELWRQISQRMQMIKMASSATAIDCPHANIREFSLSVSQPSQRMARH